MTSRDATEGRSIKKMAAVGATLTAAGASLLLLTGFPPGLASGAGASTALTELAARSPGARIGGLALKAKTKRAAPRALARGAAPAGASNSPGLGAPIASVMSAGPEGPLSAAPVGLGTLPGGLILPGTAAPAPGVVAPVPGGGMGFVPGPGGGGVIVGPGGGGPGGGGAITPTPTPTPTPTVTPPAVVPSPTPTPTTPPVAAIPEPATWLMLIVGFGFVGRTLRRRRHVRSPA